jgi:hypothetical protein
LEIKSGSPLKISGKGGMSGKHRRRKRAECAEIGGFSAFISNWVVNFIVYLVTIVYRSAIELFHTNLSSKGHARWPSQK